MVSIKPIIISFRKLLMTILRLLGKYTPKELIMILRAKLRETEKRKKNL